MDFLSQSQNIGLIVVVLVVLDHSSLASVRFEFLSFKFVVFY